MNSELGQHFLVDEKILADEIKEADLKKSDFVLEIGAGKGILTKKLVEKSGKVLSFEIDKSFKKELKNLEKRYSNLKIIYDTNAGNHLHFERRK